MENKNIVVIVAIAVVLIVAIAVFSFISLDQTIEDNEEESAPQLLTQQEAIQLALDANYDWVLELNALGRAEADTAVLEGNTWVVKIKNYQRPEDQKGFLIVYRVDALAGEVSNKTTREEVN